MYFVIDHFRTRYDKADTQGCHRHGEKLRTAKQTAKSWNRWLNRKSLHVGPSQITDSLPEIRTKSWRKITNILRNWGHSSFIRHRPSNIKKNLRNGDNVVSSNIALQNQRTQVGQLLSADTANHISGSHVSTASAKFYRARHATHTHSPIATYRSRPALSESRLPENVTKSCAWEPFASLSSATS